jgi:type VI secretion system protein ImpJ
MNDIKQADDLKLALNQWESGQILMPAHFAAQETALLAGTILASDLRGLPFYGIGRLEWEAKLLAQGTVQISRLSVVFLSGDMLAVPGNAVIDDLTLPATTQPLDLHLRLLNKTTSASGIDLYKGDSKDVTRVIHHLKLSTSVTFTDAGSSFKLATLEKAKEGWRVARMAGDGLLATLPTHLPPLLQVGPNPFLRDFLKALEDRLKEVQIDLREQLKSSFFRGESMTNARRFQLATYRLRAQLADIQREIRPHPYLFLDALRAFYAEACVLQNVEPEDFDPEPYDHNALAACLSAFCRRLSSLLTVGLVPSPSLPFVQEPGDNRLVASLFPDALLEAAEVYLVVQRPDPATPVKLHNVKLASPKRLEIVHGRALSGVRFTRVTVGFPHTFGPDVDLYKLELGDDWRYAKQESALACYVHTSLEKAQLALFWRTP